MVKYSVKHKIHGEICSEGGIEGVNRFKFCLDVL